MNIRPDLAYPPESPRQRRQGLGCLALVALLTCLAFWVFKAAGLDERSVTVLTCVTAFVALILVGAMMA